MEYIPEKDCVTMQGEVKYLPALSRFVGWVVDSQKSRSKGNEPCKFSIVIAIVDSPVRYCSDYYLFCCVFVAKIKTCLEGKICSYHGLWLGLRKANSHYTGQDGSFCVGDLFNKRRRTEFEIGDKRQTENFSVGCDKLSTDQRCVQRGEEGNFFGYVAQTLSALCTLSRNKNIGTQGVQELYLLELTKKAWR